MKDAHDTSNPTSRSFKHRIRTKVDIERQERFNELAVYLQDLTMMLITLKELNVILENNDVMLSDNLKASVRSSILQNFEKRMLIIHC